MTITLTADKVTPGAVRFVELDGDTDRPLNIYLRKEQVEALGKSPVEGEVITLTIA